MSDSLTVENLLNLTENTSASATQLNVTCDKRNQYFYLPGMSWYAQPLGRADLPPCSKNFPPRRLFNKALVNALVKVPRGQYMNFLITPVFTLDIAGLLYNKLVPDRYPNFSQTFEGAWMISFRYRYEDIQIMVSFEDYTVEFFCGPHDTLRSVITRRYDHGVTDKTNMDKTSLFA